MIICRQSVPQGDRLGLFPVRHRVKNLAFRAKDRSDAMSELSVFIPKYL
jgi:hypothetical protein